MTYTPLRTWDITGWEGQSLDNKPFMAVSPVNGHVFVTDPEKPRVLEFDPQGDFDPRLGRLQQRARWFWPGIWGYRGARWQCVGQRWGE